MWLEKQGSIEESNYSRIVGRKKEMMRLRRALIKDKQWIKPRLNKKSSK